MANMKYLRVNLYLIYSKISMIIQKGIKTQLEVLMKEVTSFIKDGDTAVQIIPMLKEYLEINVKNDDQLVKSVAHIVQRIIASESKGSSEEEFGLSEAEKEQLMSAMRRRCYRLTKSFR